MTRQDNARNKFAHYQAWELALLLRAEPPSELAEFGCKSSGKWNSWRDWLLIVFKRYADNGRGMYAGENQICEYLGTSRMTTRKRLEGFTKAGIIYVEKPAKPPRLATVYGIIPPLEAEEPSPVTRSPVANATNDQEPESCSRCVWNLTQTPPRGPCSKHRNARVADFEAPF